MTPLIEIIPFIAEGIIFYSIEIDNDSLQSVILAHKKRPTYTPGVNSIRPTGNILKNQIDTLESLEDFIDLALRIE